MCYLPLPPPRPDDALPLPDDAPPRLVALPRPTDGVPALLRPDGEPTLLRLGAPPLLPEGVLTLPRLLLVPKESPCLVVGAVRVLLPLLELPLLGVTVPLLRVLLPLLGATIPFPLVLLPLPGAAMPFPLLGADTPFPLPLLLPLPGISKW